MLNRKGIRFLCNKYYIYINNRCMSSKINNNNNNSEVNYSNKINDDSKISNYIDNNDNNQMNKINHINDNDNNQMSEINTDQLNKSNNKMNKSSLSNTPLGTMMMPGMGSFDTNSNKNNDKKKKEKKFIPLSVWFSILVPLVAYNMWRKDRRNKFIDWCKSNYVSADRAEITRYCKKADLTYDDLLGIYGEAKRRYKDRKVRPSRHLNQFFPSTATSFYGQSDDVDIEPELFSSLVHQATADETKTNTWSAMLLFRQIQEASVKPIRLPLNHMLIGISQLAQDIDLKVNEDKPYQYKIDLFSPFSSDEIEFMVEHYLVLSANDPKHVKLYNRKKKKKEIQRRERWGVPLDMTKKIDLAFQVVDKDKDGKITYEELEKLLDVMIRTGHFETESLIETIDYLPPKFDIIKVDRLAALYLDDWMKLYSKPNNNSISMKMSLREFKDISLSLTTAKVLQLWYLVPPSWVGFFKRNTMCIEEIKKRHDQHLNLKIPPVKDTK